MGKLLDVDVIFKRKPSPLGKAERRSRGKTHRQEPSGASSAVSAGSSLIIATPARNCSAHRHRHRHRARCAPPINPENTELPTGRKSSPVCERDARRDAFVFHLTYISKRLDILFRTFFTYVTVRRNLRNVSFMRFSYNCTSQTSRLENYKMYDNFT